MSRRTISRIAAAGAALLAMLLLAPATGQAATITSETGPLTEIVINPDLSCQVRYGSETGYSFFPSADATQPRCRTYIARGSTVFGQFSPSGDLIPRFQSGVSGDGSAADPFFVHTEACAGTAAECDEGTAPLVTSEVRYVVGEDFFRTDLRVFGSGIAETIGIYQYGDCFLQGSDLGYGFHDASTGGIYCSENPNNVPEGRLIGFVPISPGSTWMEGDHNSSVRAQILSEGPLPNTCECEVFQDNAAALAWTGIALAPFGVARRSFLTAFSPPGLPVEPPPQVTLDSPPDGYTSEDNLVDFAGTAGTAPGDTPEVLVEVFEGSTIPEDFPFNDFTADVNENGTWSVEDAFLPPGTYTARARQTNDGGNEGFSEPVTFTIIDTTALTLTPQDARNPIGTEHTVTATLTTNRQGGADDRPILFTVTGANPTPLDDEIWIDTDEQGVATFTYSGTNRGVDTITACADLDFNDSFGALDSGEPGIGVRGFGECDPDEPTATATKRWFDPSVPPPVTTIDSGPTGSTQDQTPRFEFSSPDQAATFECSVDGGEFEPCTSPFVTDPLADGEHTLEVRATDIVGDTGPVATREFVVDTTPPATTITSGPTGLISDPTPTFAFSSSEPGSTFECRVDEAEFAACASGFSPMLGDGAHVIEVRAVDAAGNADPSAAQRAIVVDATAPETTITDGPTGTTADATPQFVFSSNEPGAEFECRVDGGSFAPCSSPFETAPLVDGSHTFEVRATDAAGNTDLSPATRSFVVDVAGPTTTVTSGPSGSINDATAQFAFSSSEPNSTFECRLDGGSFEPCSSPFETGPLSEGAHTFEVRATDALGNTGPIVSRTFTRDVTVPTTQILFPAEGATRAQPVFVFVADEPDTSFECRVDDGEFEPCASPYLTDPSLSDGPHSFDVRAIDAAGNVGPVSSRAFVKDSTPPQAEIASGPSGPVSDPTPTFEFSASEPGSTFECRIDGGPFEPCSSPFETPALPPGEHTLEVRARDAAGNTSPVVSRTFTVVAAQTPPPPPPPPPPAGAGTPPPPPPPPPGPPVEDRDNDGIPDADDRSDASVGPTLAQTVIAQIVSGDVFVRRPAGSESRSAVRAAQAGTPKGYVPLKGAEVLPVGTIVHAVRGRLRLTSAASRLRGRTQTQRAEFYRGIFQIRQRRARFPTTDIALRSTNYVKECGSAARARAGSAASDFDVFAAQNRKRSKKVISRLWGNGKGRFRTLGRHSAATVRGTVWLTQERCDGTLTHVTRGVVSVRDNRARRTVTVRAGRSYLARAIRATVRTRRPGGGRPRTP